MRSRVLARSGPYCRRSSTRRAANSETRPWDWRFYAEKERRVRFDLDEGELRPYLQLDTMIAAAFDCATRLFGLRFREIADQPRYHPDVRAWEVMDAAGRHVGLFLGDYFVARR